MTSHFEVGTNHQEMRNLMTTSILSELHGLLKREFPHIPVYISYSSESSERHPDSDNIIRSSTNPDKIELDLMSHFNKALTSAIINATRESIKRKQLMGKEAVISLIYAHALKDLNSF